MGGRAKLAIIDEYGVLDPTAKIAEGSLPSRLSAAAIQESVTGQVNTDVPPLVGTELQTQLPPLVEAQVPLEVEPLVEAQVPPLVQAQVPPLVTAALAADSAPATAAAAAVDAKVAGLSLVKTTDPGIPVAGEPNSLYSVVWRNKFLQMIMALTETNRLKLFKGLELGSTAIDSVADDIYIKATKNLSKQISEDALLLNGTVPGWVLARWKTRMGLDPVPPANLKTTYVVKKDGTGDFTNVKAANTAFIEGAGKTCEIIVYPGIYTENEMIVKEGVTIRGINREACILDGSLPASADDTAISNTSTLWLRKTARLENLTVLMKNGRYAVHAEDSGGSVNARHDLVNCRFEHLGNQEVVAYRAANSLPAGTVWASDRAWGYGSSSGWYQRFENCTFVSRRGAWYVHDNKDFALPMNHDLINCRIISREYATSTFDVQSLGSGQSSRVNVNGSECSFLQVLDTDLPWITQAPANQVSQHSQIRVTVDGTDPIGYRSANRGKALKIESSSTGTVSSVRITGGTAAPLLWGDGTYRDGGGGLKGYGYGFWDISGILVGISSTIAVDNTLGKRLGDCSVTAKTLLISVDGGAAVTVTFNQDHTAQSNATVLSIINTALGISATASEYLVTQGETYAQFPDRQKTKVNSGTLGIPRWAAVKLLASGDIALLELADPASAMIGVALEPIPPGKVGWILTSGLLYKDQLPGFTAAISSGTSIYLSDVTAGTYSNTGTRKVLTGHVTDWAKF